jgi:hypothetical protein
MATPQTSHRGKGAAQDTVARPEVFNAFDEASVAQHDAAVLAKRLAPRTSP